MTAPFIVGAGLTGLLAACAWPRMPIMEAAAEPRASHHALLRFRTDAVSHLTGIAFRKVRVHKGIYSRGKFVAPNIGLANRYSLKLTGTLQGDRSIWNVEAADRYIAPHDFYEQLVDAVGSRIHWGTTVNLAEASPCRQAIVSTIPLPVTLQQLGAKTPHPFTRAPITVDRFKLPQSDVFQTVYFPNPDTPIYRASITGDLLIVESTAPPDSFDPVFEALEVLVARQIDTVKQEYGKIAPIADDAARRALLFSLTRDHGIYSLGRFATWRNILLDDVVGDISVIKGMLRSDSYAHRLAEIKAGS